MSPSENENVYDMDQMDSPLSPLPTFPMHRSLTKSLTKEKSKLLVDFLYFIYTLCQRWATWVGPPELSGAGINSFLCKIFIFFLIY